MTKNKISGAGEGNKMEKFLNWIGQTSTKVALATAVVAIVGILVASGRLDPVWTPVVAAVVSAFGLRVNDKGTGGGGAVGLVCVLALGTTIGCGVPLPDLPISDDEKLDIAITAGCSAAASAGCLEDDDVVDLFGDLKTAPQCAAAVKAAIETKHLSIDLSKLTARNMTCKKFVSAFQI